METEKNPTIADILNKDKEDNELDISPQVLDKVDLSLPQEYLIEIVAEELVGYLTNYHQYNIGYRTARASGDHQKAEQLYKQMSHSRLAAALIQSEYKGIKELADKIAGYRVETVKKSREAKDKIGG